MLISGRAGRRTCHYVLPSGMSGSERIGHPVAAKMALAIARGDRDQRRIARSG